MVTKLIRLFFQGLFWPVTLIMRANKKGTLSGSSTRRGIGRLLGLSLAGMVLLLLGLVFSSQYPSVGSFLETVGMLLMFVGLGLFFWTIFQKEEPKQEVRQDELSPEEEAARQEILHDHFMSLQEERIRQNQQK